MSDLIALQRLRQERHFDAWDEFLEREHVAASEANMRELIDALIALGPKPTENAARKAVDACVQAFNDIDDGWICTIEREDICDQICRVVEACGFECEEDWLSERDW
jgi:hypothetical protein